MSRMNAELRRVRGFVACLGLIVIAGCAGTDGHGRTRTDTHREVIELYLPPVKYSDDLPSRQ